MPRRSFSQRPSSYAVANLASYISSIRQQFYSSGAYRDEEHFLKKARRSVLSFLNDVGVYEYAEKIYENLEYLITFRIGHPDYIKGIVQGVIDTIYDNEQSMLPHAS